MMLLFAYFQILRATISNNQVCHRNFFFSVAHNAQLKKTNVDLQLGVGALRSPTPTYEH